MPGVCLGTGFITELTLQPIIMELLKARAIAVAVCESIEPFTTKLHIAGSIRRKKPDVKDIEICVLPKFDISYTTDLFGNKTPVNKIQFSFIKAVEGIGKIEKGNAYGRYMKIVLSEGINLDLFIPDEEDFQRQFAIRTGSADYSHKILANAWRKLGWVGTNIGLRRVEDCLEHKQEGVSSTWECIKNRNNKPPFWQTEEEFFAWLGIAHIGPEYRNV